MGRGGEAMALTIYFATNRRVLKDGEAAEVGEDFHPNIDELRFGKVSFAGKDLYKKNLEDFIDKAAVTVAKDALSSKDAHKSKLASRAIFKEVRAEMLHQRDATHYVPGYDPHYRYAETGTASSRNRVSRQR